MSEHRASRRKKLLREWKAAYWLKQNPPGSQEQNEAEQFYYDPREGLQLPPDPAERAWMSDQGTSTLSEVRSRREAAERSVPAGLRASEELPPVWDDVEQGRTPFLMGLAQAAMTGTRNWPAPPVERYPNGMPKDNGTVIAPDGLRPVKPGPPPGVDPENEVTIVAEEEA
ncbi:hypothetical protein [Streptomyces sp. AP-93]|uniref:hypothetical protein n=1 Tax=Streptomyces sp. AP-93 TaxID=2929048 RepID=UPI001FAEC037|nr:hypothetical protein [Streptomyces sp. AP-93]MCJ0868096.1 hypothetical protein [Streptomyces sp. AP-93]